ncbi:hypothetical protein F4782DRAFT_480859 [Xylaria castorea]|nr:hypothetical protein F4782DRAFT_480859 [Xylaria castorea]
MSLRSTLAITALCRWRTPRYPQVLEGFKLQSISVRHIRWSSSNNQDTSPRVDLSKTHRDSTVFISSPDGGRITLDILKYLEDSDSHRMVLKGIICLQAYYDRINILSVEEAEKVIASDDAGRIVYDWVSQPSVWKEIESNNEHNAALLQLVTYILVGARLTGVIETWIRYPKTIRPMTAPLMTAFQCRFNWKALMIRMSTTALILWHPQGLADGGYDFFSRKFDEFCLDDAKLTGDFDKFSDYLWVYVVTELEMKHINRKHAASSRSFERCANRIAAYRRTWCPPGQTLQTGILALKHPNRPSADQFLAACLEIYRDRDHPLRSYSHKRLWKPLSSQPESMRAYARFLCACGSLASTILYTQRRSDEQTLVLKIVDQIWGRHSDFFDSCNLYPERLEMWERRNQETMRNLHPKFYVPFVF